jgi:FkbM family methyltransferase
MKNCHGYWLPDDEEHFSKFIIRNNGAGYQENIRNLALSYVDKFNVSVDIGANFGLWSHSLEKKFKSNYAIEPIDDHCEYLKINAPTTSIHQCALGNKSGVLKMQRDFENYGKTHISETGDVTVQVVTLDSLNLPPADFIKIDVEGFEYYVLLGSEKYIKQSYPVLVIEQEKKNPEINKLLISWGYELVDSIKHDYIYKKLT